MSTGTYFVTDEARKAKNWEIVEQYQEAKKELVRLENEAKKVGERLIKIGGTLENPRGHRFGCGDAELSIFKNDPSSSSEELITRVPWKDLNIDLRTLLRDLETAKRKTSELTSQLQELGIHFGSCQ
jgi:hypothetical protein